MTYSQQMNDFINLRRFFNPVQPRFNEGGDGVIYSELAPASSLSGFICCYWHLASTKSFSVPFVYTVVADGCIDFFFDLNDPREYFVMGFSSAHASFPLQKDFNYVGVRFFPGAFPALFNIEASLLTNQCYFISEVVPEVSKKLKGLLTRSSNFEHIKVSFDHYFREKILAGDVNFDRRFAESLAAVLRSGGSLNVERDVASTVSPRHLRRLFDFYIGGSPKEFSKIVRFQKFLNGIQSRHALRNEKSYYTMGYYDQSHFIKDFKQFYGAAPLKAFAT